MIDSFNTSSRFQQRFVFFFIALMSIQILAIEGMDVSVIKAVCMAVTPLVLLSYGKGILVTKAIFWGFVYFASIVICSLLAFDAIQWQRIIFRGLYICMFISVVQIFEANFIPIKTTKKFIKYLLIAYFVILILQQLFMLVGIINFPIINLIRESAPENILKVNSLAIEASHAVRIVTVLFYVYIRLCELSDSSSLSIKQFLQDNKYISIGYFYFIISIGSATGLVGLSVVLLYFFKRNLNTSLLVIAVVLILISQFMGEEVDRINNIVESFSADDIGAQMRKTESSGAVRINGFVNTFKYLDLSTKEAWIGQGSSTLRSIEMIYSRKTMIGDITNYGIITYILSLMFVFRASICRFFSIETLFFITLFGAGVGSVYYIWSALMLFYIINYYERKNDAENFNYQSV